MESQAASSHAQAVAREAVASGLTDQETARRLYQEFAQYLRQGTRGTFTQLLLSRGAIDPAGFRHLQERLPFSSPGSPSPGPSGAFSAVAASAASPAAAPPAPPAQPAPPAPPAQPRPLEALDVERTMEFDAVLSAAAGGLPAAPPAPERKPAKLKSVDELGESVVESLDLAEDAQGEREREFFAAAAGGSDDDMEPLRPVREPKVGENLGDYTLTRILGRGGMGVIYEARKAGAEASFALKVLTTPQANQGDRERFQREVEALRRLSHPNIVRVHTCGRDDDLDWYVMDVVDGKELKDLLSAKTLKPMQRLKVYSDICGAVQHAHERGVVHRDLKPANVIVRPEDLHVIVLDFGLAKLADQDLGLTRTGAALGTPYYMAPEQLVNPKGVDARSDVFALGVILYEMMTGHRPFVGQTFAEIGDKIMHTDPPRPSTLTPTLLPAFDAIVMKAIEKDPSQRHQDVASLKREVDRYRQGFGLSENTALQQQAHSARRWLTRNLIPVVVGVVLASLVYVPLLILVFLFF